MNRKSKRLAQLTLQLLCAASFAGFAQAEDFNIPRGDLKAALDTYATQTGTQFIYESAALKGIQTNGVHGNVSADTALTRILSGTGFTMRKDATGAIGITRSTQSAVDMPAMTLAQAAPARAAVETVMVTSSKLGGADVQSIPIAITALSQEQLTATQTAGGPDLVKQVPNLTFSKTNFTGYNIQIRGIGTQAISVTTDPAVAVAFNDVPFIRNHFFEQEFFDVSQVEVLRGPQGTLYGRNATAGVVNVVSAKPSDQFEAMVSADWGNYNNRRYEGMVNIPIVDDRIDLRVAGEWTKRDGYAFNETTGKHIDGRDLWSTRVSLRYHPLQHLDATLIWEHFQEDDDRARSTKQLCKKDVGPDSVDGFDITNLSTNMYGSETAAYRAMLSQGCLPTSFYSADAYQTPNGQANPLVAADEFSFSLDLAAHHLLNQVDPYASVSQPRDLRTIQSELTPSYRAKNDTYELNADYDVTPELKLTSQTGYNQDSLGSTEDFNRFNTAPGLFSSNFQMASIEEFLAHPTDFNHPPVAINGIYCDPQLGCSDKMVGEDLSREHAWQFNQEIRLASNYTGPFNFSLGANFTRYETVEDYFVFLNLISATTQIFNNSLPGDFGHCYAGTAAYNGSGNEFLIPSVPQLWTDPGTNALVAVPSNFGCYNYFGTYIDPNPITSINGQGHNYFRSDNPYRLTSYAGFGEVYYQVAPDLKLTGGLRWTDDRKHFDIIPSWVFEEGGGYPVTATVDQEWKELTGRFNVSWTPRLDFTDATLIYASYARGYKAGGANPPGPQGLLSSVASQATHPLAFNPEFVNAFELGTKNSLWDGSMVLNGDVFYYDYKGYQISQIVDRTSINLNFDAKVKGLELESTWKPLPGLSFKFAGGYEASSVNKGQSAIDLMDRTARHSDWMVVKPGIADTSNCILPAYVMREILEHWVSVGGRIPTEFLFFDNPCDVSYNNPLSSLYSYYNLQNRDGITDFDPSTAPNGGAGFAKDLGGNELPNTPHFTANLSAEYTIPVSDAWAATLHSDFYWQSQSYARIFNDRPYDRLRGYSNVNLALILTSADGWQVTGYLKNVFDATAITGAFLNSDDTWLTTNVFVTDPRLFGVRVTKNW
jgi:outer membrane receptor protein involved in Fe transport